MNSKVFSRVCLVLLILPVSTGAFGARITSISFCEQVAGDGTVPINVTSRFSADVPSIHAVINMEGVREGTIVRGVWVSIDAIEAPNYEIDAAEAAAPSSDAVVHFALSRPDNGWPTGNYKLDVYVDGDFALSAPFSVVGGPDRGKSAAKRTAGGEGGTREAPGKKSAASALLGTWECQMAAGTSILVFESPTHLNLDGQRAKYTLVDGALRVQDETGFQDYPYRLQGNVLTISFAEEYELQFTKVSDETEYTGGGYTEEAGDETEAYGAPSGGGKPVEGEFGGQAPSGGDADLMNHFAGTWWNATTNTETTVTLAPDGRYFENYEASYSGSSRDQYGNTDMGWGTANDQSAQGAWTVRGTREQGVLTILFQNGNRREINYRVHVENGQVYWGEYFFNDELYGKK